MITLLPHNPNWKTLFEKEKQQLKNVLGPTATHIEHIGSTAIPGIHAKPIIDILIGVHDLNQLTQEDIKKIESLGYRYISAFESDLPHRRYFQKSDPDGNRTHQIHLVNYPSAWWERHIFFRDYMRKYPEEAKAYEDIKFTLAKQFDDTLSYAYAKTDFCERIYKEAYVDFSVHKPFVTTDRLYGYIPQKSCFDLYKAMFQDPNFIRCFGVTLTDDYLKKMLVRDTNYWDQYGFGPLVWFDKASHDFIGEGGLNHTTVEGNNAIELTYSLSKDHWGKGYAVEIGQYAIHDAFNRLHLDSIVCFTLPTNTQSLRVIEKLGFVYNKDFTHANLPHKLYRLIRECVIPFLESF